MTARLNIKLAPAMLADLQVAARVTGVPVSEQVRRAIRSFIPQNQFVPLPAQTETQK